MASPAPIGSFTGVGLGLRGPHFEAVAGGNPGVPFWEIAPENVMGDGGREHDTVCRILRRDPVITHGLSLSVGGFDPFDDAYLQELAGFLACTGSPWPAPAVPGTPSTSASARWTVPPPTNCCPCP